MADSTAVKVEVAAAGQAAAGVPKHAKLAHILTIHAARESHVRRVAGRDPLEGGELGLGLGYLASCHAAYMRFSGGICWQP